MPKDLQAKFGKKVVTKTLREQDREAAMVIALPFLSALKSEWALLRGNAVPNFDSALMASQDPSEADLILLAGEAFKRAIRTLGQKRTKQFADDPDGYSEILRLAELGQLKHVATIDAENYEQWIEPAERFLKKNNIEVDRESEWFNRFVAMLAEVTVAAIDWTNRRARGEFNVKPTSNVVLRAQELSLQAEDTENDLPFSKLVDTYMRQWKASANDRKKTNTEQQKRSTFSLFAGYCADKPIRSIRSKEAAEFRDILNLFEPNWARSPRFRGMLWDDLVRNFGDRPRGLSDATMNRHMRALKALWSWARRRGFCDGENPFDGFHTKLRPGVNCSPYLPWEMTELQLLLEPPPKRDDVLEVIIVGLFSGMRLDEIASLTWDRVRSRWEDDVVIHYFQIDDAKTPAGVRQVPIHPSLGWLISRKPSLAQGRIWPNFNEEGVGKKPGADAGREFSSFKKARGFVDRKKVFHSFRKNVTGIMERAKVPENDWAQVFGHERGFTYTVYSPDGITLGQKAEIISKIDYPDLRIPHPSIPPV